MSDSFEERVRALRVPFDNADWHEVRRRAEHLRARRRRTFAMCLVAVGVIAVAGPALAVRLDLLPWFHGTPAPTFVKESFERDFAAELPNLERERGLRVDQAHGVLAIASPVGTVRVWAAPTQSGGECRLMQIGDDDHAFRCIAAGDSPSAGFERLSEAGYVLIDGWVGVGGSASLRFADGSEEAMPVVDGWFVSIVDERAHAPTAFALQSSRWSDGGKGPLIIPLTARK